MYDTDRILYENIKVREDDLYALVKFKIVEELLGDQSPLKIIDVGSGSGELCFRLAGQGHRVLGIDPSPEFVRLAKDALAQQPSFDCSFAVSSIEEFGSEEAFDCIVACDILEHIKDDKRAIGKMANLVRPGGCLIMTVPCGRWLFGYYDRQLGHYRRYTTEGVKSLLDSFFEIESIRHFGFTALPALYLYNKVIRKPFPVSRWRGVKANPISAFIMKAILNLDKNIHVPFGATLITKGTRK